MIHKCLPDQFENLKLVHIGGFVFECLLISACEINVKQDCLKITMAKRPLLLLLYQLQYQTNCVN